ncbi:MAG: hypothetical protein SFU86_21135 [Pirellulaceae bacterium]|nr:hypothetical protein [Pirellulaceae bacterium]
MKRSALSRRLFLAAGSALAGAGLMGPPRPRAEETAGPTADSPPKTSRLAAINSIFRLRSHAYHIVGRMVHGYEKDGFHHQPPVRMARMMNDQSPAGDLGQGFCQRHGIKLCKSVAETLGPALDVDGVLLIIEHGDYPVNEFGQVLYPRYDFFRQIVEVFERVGRSVPVFVDKHLSYDHRRAAEMVATAKKLGFPLMAGSSLPVTWRIPDIEPPLGTPFAEAVCTFGFDRGPAEIYLFHALETLQCLVERRPSGETGVKSVRCLAGDEVWRAIDRGQISARLVDAAIARCPSRNVGPLRENVTQPLAIVIEYADGTRGAVLNLVEQTSEFGFAATVKGQAEPIATYFHLPSPPGARFFDPLCWNIERLLTTGQSPYPVERTQLTSTVLDIALHSLKEGGRALSDPALAIRYRAPAESGHFRGPDR